MMTNPVDPHKLSEFATLNGYEADLDPNASASAHKKESDELMPSFAEKPSEPEDPHQLLDPSDYAEPPSVVKTHFLSGSKVPKLGLYLGIGFFVFGFSALQTFVFSPNRQTTASEAPDEREKTAESDIFVKEGEDREVGQIKSEMALQTQAKELKELNASPSERQQPQRKTEPVQQQPTKPPEAVKPKPVKVPPRPSPPRPRTVARAQPPRPQPIQRSVQQIKRQIPRPLPSPSQDPQQLWLATAKLGSYGTVSDTPPVKKSQEDELVKEKTILANYEQELPILQEQARQIQRVPVGANAGGRIDQTLAWEGQPSQLLTIRLTEPLLDAQGEAIAESGSLVIAEVNKAGGSGLVSLTAKILVVVTETGDYQEIPLAPDSISVTKAGGQPLMAQRIGGENPKGQGRGLDVMGFAFDAFSTAMEFSDTGNSYQDLYRRQRLQRMYDRHLAQQQQSPYQYRPTVPSASAWMIPAGLEVEIYINRSIDWFKSEN